VPYFINFSLKSLLNLIFREAIPLLILRDLLSTVHFVAVWAYQLLYLEAVLWKDLVELSKYEFITSYAFTMLEEMVL
jgi:hypothetical protein